jgi:hypothetical protein
MRVVLAALAVSLGLAAAPAFAEGETPATEAAGSNYDQLTQVELTAAQIDNYIASIGDMQAAMGDAPADAAEPDAKTMAKLETIARKYGFKDFNDYNTVAGNISLVLDGVDAQTKTYVGADKLIEKNIAEVKADKQMKEPERKTALTELQAQQKALTAIKYKGNIDLVVNNYDKLAGSDPAAAK